MNSYVKKKNKKKLDKTEPKGGGIEKKIVHQDLRQSQFFLIIGFVVKNWNARMRYTNDLVRHQIRNNIELYVDAIQ